MSVLLQSDKFEFDKLSGYITTEDGQKVGYAEQHSNDIWYIVIQSAHYEDKKLRNFLNETFKSDGQYQIFVKKDDGLEFVSRFRLFSHSTR